MTLGRFIDKLFGVQPIQYIDNAELQNKTNSELISLLKGERLSVGTGQRIVTILLERLI